MKDKVEQVKQKNIIVSRAFSEKLQKIIEKYNNRNDEKDVFEKKCPNIQTAIYDDFFPFPDKSFDIGWGSAVIEHIENREKQLLFLKELQQMHHAVFFLQLSI